MNESVTSNSETIEQAGSEPERFIVLTGLYQIETLPSGEEIRFPVIFCPKDNQSGFISEDEVQAARLNGSSIECPDCETPHRLIEMPEALKRNLVCCDGDAHMVILVLQEVVANSLRALKRAKSAA